MEQPVAEQQSEQPKKKVWIVPVVEVIDQADVETGHNSYPSEAIFAPSRIGPNTAYSNYHS